MANKTIIFDLDHTLLNSQKLKEKLAEIIGISLTLYNSSYKEFLSEMERKTGRRKYSFEEHIKFLENSEKNNGKKIEYDLIIEKFNKELPSLEEFLNDEAIDAVKNIGEIGDRKVLLTFGNKDWQMEKINKLSELANSFDEIVYAEKSKGNPEILREIIRDNSEVMIINDNLEETIKMVKAIEDIGVQKCEVMIIESNHSRGQEGDKEREILRKRAEEMGFKFYEDIKDLVFPKKEYADEFKRIK